jgi:hypothetical protein
MGAVRPFEAVPFHRKAKKEAEYGNRKTQFIEAVVKLQFCNSYRYLFSIRAGFACK